MESDKKTVEENINQEISSENTIQEKVLKTLESNLELNRETLRSVKFLKNYFYWKTIFSFVKIVIVVAIIVLGFMSLKPIVSYLETFVNDLKLYSDQIDGASSKIEGIRSTTNLNKY